MHRGAAAAVTIVTTVAATTGEIITDRTALSPEKKNCRRIHEGADPRRKDPDALMAAVLALPAVRSAVSSNLLGDRKVVLYKHKLRNIISMDYRQIIRRWGAGGLGTHAPSLRPS